MFSIQPNLETPTQFPSNQPSGRPALLLLLPSLLLWLLLLLFLNCIIIIVFIITITTNVTTMIIVVLLVLHYVQLRALSYDPALSIWPNLETPTLFPSMQPSTDPTQAPIFHDASWSHP